MHQFPKVAGFALLLLAAAPVFAGPPGWGPSGANSDPWSARGAQRDLGRMDGDRKEGRVEVTRFVAQDQRKDELGRGPITVVSLDDGQPKNDGEALPAGEFGLSDRSPADLAQPDPRETAMFEAAVIDQLVKAGYDTNGVSGSHGQTAQLRIVRAVAEPAEAPHKPVSGMMEVGVSNRGSMTGMGINIDLTKPRSALLSTKLEARIRDEQTGAVLWEGRADIVTRDGDADWTAAKIAERLSAALFRDFPGNSGETYSMR